MDYDTPDFLLPGAAYDFHDVTELFEEAASEMEPGEMIFMEGFVLQDAMSAFEIGEPRLDTGLTIPEQNRKEFDPLALMLPEELCWIIDRSFAYEMAWHAGNFLCHTVFTCLYVHHLAEIDPDIIPYEVHLQADPQRPTELITLVLRFAMQGLLKCCDLAWRELSKNGVQDSEDWQSDKCEVSLLEGVPVEHVLSGLDDAILWLSNSMQVESPWKEALLARVRFRKVFLQVMNSDIFRDQLAFQNLLNQAQVELRSLIAMPALEFSPNTLPYLSFDPYIGRRLNSFVPIRVLTLPEMSDTWKAFGDFFDGLYEISLLSNTKSLSTWKCVGNLRIWLSDPPLRIAYLRSRTQSTFYDGLLILGKYTFSWMVDQFFHETVGITYNSISNLIKDVWTREEPPPLSKLERILYKLITPHIRALWYNPPRRRRHYMKSLLDWHKLYDAFVDITALLSQEHFRENPLLRQLPKLALVWSLPSMREVVLSGFQLELYSREEKPVAYWFTAEIIDAQLACYDELILVIPKDSKAYREALYQQQWLTALQSICIAMFVITMPFTSYDWDRIRPNFYRRYKWAFRPEYDKITTLALVHPRLLNLMQTCSVILDRDDVMSPSGLIDFAHTLLLDLSESGNLGGWAGQWDQERKAMIQNLLGACEALCGLPAIFDPKEGINITTLRWNPDVHPWFPTLTLCRAV